jgi:hypothetical protein
MSHDVSPRLDDVNNMKGDGIVVVIVDFTSNNLICALIRVHPLDTLTAFAPALSASIAKNL